jgi:hypothetical protein
MSAIINTEVTLMKQNDKIDMDDPIDVWTARYHEEEEQAMKEVLAMSPEELAAGAKRYPKDMGGFNRNPYMD